MEHKTPKPENEAESLDLKTVIEVALMNTCNIIYDEKKFGKYTVFNNNDLLKLWKGERFATKPKEVNKEGVKEGVKEEEKEDKGEKEEVKVTESILYHDSVEKPEVDLIALLEKNHLIDERHIVGEMLPSTFSLVDLGDKSPIYRIISGKMDSIWKERDRERNQAIVDKMLKQNVPLETIHTAKKVHYTEMERQYRLFLEKVSKLHPTKNEKDIDVHRATLRSTPLASTFLYGESVPDVLAYKFGLASTSYAMCIRLPKDSTVGTVLIQQRVDTFTQYLLRNTDKSRSLDDKLELRDLLFSYDITRDHNESNLFTLFLFIYFQPITNPEVDDAEEEDLVKQAGEEGEIVEQRQGEEGEIENEKDVIKTE